MAQDPQGTPYFLCRSGFMQQALMEARRTAPATEGLQIVNNETFEQALLATYQQNSSQARQMMENLGNEVDFYSL
ncbi:MAG: type II secretion system protein GspE, partial [Enterobacteriaceae bacterium]